MLVAGANFALNIQLFRGKPLAVAGPGVPLLQPWKIAYRENSPREE
jgi:hypothetical protein